MRVRMMRRAVREMITRSPDRSYNQTYLFALHTDKKHPHVRLLRVMRVYDGAKLDPRKAGLLEGERAPERLRAAIAHVAQDGQEP